MIESAYLHQSQIVGKIDVRSLIYGGMQYLWRILIAYQQCWCDRMHKLCSEVEDFAFSDDPDGNDFKFQIIINSSLSTDTSLVKCF